MGILNIKDGNQWRSILAIKGEKGDTGERGLQGEQGIPGQGIASGGTAGQVLVKTSSTDYATGWSDVPSELMLITVTGTSTLSSDKTQSEITTAYNAGKVMVVKNNNDLYMFTKYENSKFYFGMHDDISGNDVIQLTVIEIASNGINKTSSYVESSSMHMASIAYDSTSWRKYINEYASSLYQLFDTEPIRAVCVSDNLSDSGVAQDDIRHKYIVRAVEETDNGVSTYRFYLLNDASLEIYEGSSEGYAQLKSDTVIDYAKNTKTKFVKTPLFSYDNDDQNAEFEVKAYIDPVQDLHGYDNPWPAGGGKNKLNTLGTDTNKGYVSGKYLSSSGGEVGGYGGYITEYTPILPSTTYALSGTYGSAPSIGFYDSSKTFISSVQYAGVTFRSFTTPSNAAYYRASVNSTEMAHAQLELGSSATSWSPYSNICPISGWTEAKVTRTGINVWDEEWELGSINFSTGAKQSSSTNIRSKNYIPIVGGKTYYGKTGTLSSSSCVFFFYTEDKSYISNAYCGNTAFTAPSNAKYGLFYCGSAYGTTYNSDISFNYPSTDHDYHAYAGQTVTIQFGQTVYGGTVDVTRGKMRITDQIYSVSGGFTVAGNGAFYKEDALSGAKTTLASVPEFVSSMYQTYKTGVTGTPAAVQNPGKLCYQNTADNTKIRLLIYDTTFASVSDFNTALSNTPMQVVFPIATPVEIDLTPTEIALLYGDNNVWSDTGDVEVTVKQGIEAYVDRRSLPLGGTAGQILTKASGTDYDVSWGNAPSTLPSGGSAGQVLMKSSATDGDVSWGSESFIIPITKSGSNYSTSMSVTQIMDAYNAGKKLYISVPSASSYSGRTSTDYYKLSRVQVYSNGYQYVFYFSGAPYVNGNSAEFRSIYININTNTNTKQVYQSGNLTYIVPTPKSAINVYYQEQQGQDPYYEMQAVYGGTTVGDYVNLDELNPVPNDSDWDQQKDRQSNYFPLYGIVVGMEETYDAEYNEDDEQWEYHPTYLIHVLSVTSSGQTIYTFSSDDYWDFCRLSSTTPIGANSGGGTMYVHITYANNAYSADKTFAEITQAVSDGSSVCAILGNDYCPLNSINSSSALFKNNGENVSNHFPTVKTVTISSSNTVSATNIQLTGKNVVDTILIRFDVLLDSNNNKLYIEGSPDSINDLGNDYLYSICEWQGSECSLPVRITKEDVTVSGSTETKITISVDRWENGSLIVHNFTGTTDGSYSTTGFYEESTIDVAQSILSQIPTASGVSF